MFTTFHGVVVTFDLRGQLAYIEGRPDEFRGNSILLRTAWNIPARRNANNARILSMIDALAPAGSDETSSRLLTCTTRVNSLNLSPNFTNETGARSLDSVSRLAVLPERAWEKVPRVKYGRVGLRPSECCPSRLVGPRPTSGRSPQGCQSFVRNSAGESSSFADVSPPFRSPSSEIETFVPILIRRSAIYGAVSRLLGKRAYGNFSIGCSSNARIAADLPHVDPFGYSEADAPPAHTHTRSDRHR